MKTQNLTLQDWTVDIDGLDNDGLENDRQYIGGLIASSWETS